MHLEVGWGAFRGQINQPAQDSPFHLGPVWYVGWDRIGLFLWNMIELDWINFNVIMCLV